MALPDFAVALIAIMSSLAGIVAAVLVWWFCFRSRQPVLSTSSPKPVELSDEERADSLSATDKDHTTSGALGFQEQQQAEVFAQSSASASPSLVPLPTHDPNIADSQHLSSHVQPQPLFDPYIAQSKADTLSTSYGDGGYDASFPPAGQPQFAASYDEIAAQTEVQLAEIAELAAQLPHPDIVPVVDPVEAEELAHDTGLDDLRHWEMVPIASWSCSDVLGWLSVDLGFPRQHVTSVAFKLHGVNGAALLALTSDDLKEMGITTIGSRKTILAAVALRAARGVEARDPYRWEREDVSMWCAGIGAELDASHRMARPDGEIASLAILQALPADGDGPWSTLYREMAALLEKHDVNGGTLSALTGNDLKEIGGLFQLLSLRLEFLHRRNLIFRFAPPGRPVRSSTPRRRPFTSWSPAEVRVYLARALCWTPDCPTGLTGGAFVSATVPDFLELGCSDETAQKLAKVAYDTYGGIDVAAEREKRIIDDIVASEDRDRARVEDAEARLRIDIEMSSRVHAEAQLKKEAERLEKETEERQLCVEEEEVAYNLLQAEMESEFALIVKEDEDIRSLYERLQKELDELPAEETAARKQVEEDEVVAFAELCAAVEEDRDARAAVIAARHAEEQGAIIADEATARDSITKDESNCWHSIATAASEEYDALDAASRAARELRDTLLQQCREEGSIIANQEAQARSAIMNQEYQEREWSEKRRRDNITAINAFLHAFDESYAYGARVEALERMWGQRAELEARELVRRIQGIEAEEMKERNELMHRIMVARQLGDENDAFTSQIRDARLLHEGRIRRWIHHVDKDAETPWRPARYKSQPEEEIPPAPMQYVEPSIPPPHPGPRRETQKERNARIAEHSQRLHEGHHSGRDCCDERDEAAEKARQDQEARLIAIEQEQAKRKQNTQERTYQPQDTVDATGTVFSSAYGPPDPSKTTSLRRSGSPDTVQSGRASPDTAPAPRFSAPPPAQTD